MASTDVSQLGKNEDRLTESYVRSRLEEALKRYVSVVIDLDSRHAVNDLLFEQVK